MKIKLTITLICFNLFGLVAQTITFNAAKEKAADKGREITVAKNELFYYVLYVGKEDKNFKLAKYNSKNSDLLAVKELEIPQQNKTKVNGKYFIAYKNRLILFYMVECKKPERTVLMATKLSGDLQLSAETLRLDSAEGIGISYRVETIDSENKIVLIRNLEKTKAPETQLNCMIVDSSFKVLSKNTVTLPFKKEEGRWDFSKMVKNNRLIVLAHDVRLPAESKKQCADYLLCYNLLENKITYSKINWPGYHCYRIGILLNKKNQINVVSMFAKSEEAMKKDFNEAYEMPLDGGMAMVFDEDASQLLEKRIRDIESTLENFKLKKKTGEYYRLENINIFEDGSLAMTCERSAAHVSSYSSGNWAGKNIGSTNTTRDHVRYEFYETIIFNLTYDKGNEWMNVFTKEQVRDASTGNYPHLLHSVLILATPKYVALVMNVNANIASDMEKTKNVYDLGKLKNDDYESTTRFFLVDAKGNVDVKQLPQVEGKTLQVNTAAIKMYLSSSNAVLYGTATAAGNFCTIRID